LAVDASSLYTNATELVNLPVPRNYGANVTLLGALGVNGIQALIAVEGATDGEVFRAFVEQVSCPTLEAGDLVVMDNLSAHKVAGIKEALAGCEAQFLYLPSYWPDLSLIEQCWSKLKTFLRGLGARMREALEMALEYALEKITTADALA
jgi:transposase